MTLLLLLPKLFLAGGAFLGTLELPQTTTLYNHTLAGEKIPAYQVVTRSRWGTPMLPDGKAGYSMTAPINKKLIAESLWIPPVSGTRPTAEIIVIVATNQPTAPSAISAATSSLPTSTTTTTTTTTSSVPVVPTVPVVPVAPSVPAAPNQ